MMMAVKIMGEGGGVMTIDDEFDNKDKGQL